MDERSLVSEIEQDLRLAASTRRVVYLEGRSDVPIFLALLGRPVPRVIPDEGTFVDGVLIRGLGDRSGSGCRAVRQRLEVARRRGYRGVLGLVDGDGALDTPDVGLGPEHSGPLFVWPTYCIENLLVQAGWPSAWGSTPDWETTLRAYAPYAALNRVITWVQLRLSALRIVRFDRPQSDAPLRSAAEIRTQLVQDDETTRQLGDPGALFDLELERCEHALTEHGLARAHALINGKWLVDDYARRATGRRGDTLRDEWIDHVATTGGHSEVVRWWARVGES